MDRFTDVIDAFGTSALAEVLNIDESHVRVMKVRDSIPTQYWTPIVDAARKRRIKGVTNDLLLRLRDTRFPPQSTQRGSYKRKLEKCA